MSTLVDTLVTRYALDIKGLEEGADKAIHKLHKITETVEEGAVKAREFASVIGEKLKLGELFAPLAALATVTGIVELGKDAWNTAGKFDVLERKLAGVVGSFERAKQVMEFGEKEAGKYGIFGVEALDTAAMKLEALGLKAETYIPVLEKLGAVFGEGGEGLDQFAEALGMIASGDGQRAFRMLERAGITKPMLAQRGVTFDKDGKPTSAAPVVIKAIEGAVDSKFGGVLANMLNSDEAKAARFGVTWENVMRKSGVAIRSFLMPFVGALDEGLSRVVESGQIDRIVGGFASLFSLQPDGLTNGVERLANIIEEIPSKLQLFGQKAHELLDWLVPKVIVVGEALAALWVTDKVFEFGSAAVKAYSAVTKAISAAAAAQVVLDVATGGGAIVAAAAVAAGLAAFATISGLVDKAREAAKAFGEVEQKTGSGHYMSPEHQKVRKEMTDLAREIGSRESRFGGDNPSNESLASANARLAALLKRDRELGKQDRQTETAAQAKKAASAKAAEEAAAHASTTNGLLSQVATNTAATAQHTLRALEIQRMVLGGGELTRQLAANGGMLQSARHGGGRGGYAIRKIMEGFYELQVANSLNGQRTALDNTRQGF